MLLKTNIRFGITGALLLILLGSLQGCMSDVTGPAADPPPEECVWIDGILICP
jgi:hypothetical protein